MAYDISPFIPDDLENCKIAIVGEAPGKDEKLQGFPFVGRAGKILSEALEKASITRDACYITNVFLIQPPGNDVTFFFTKTKQIHEGSKDFVNAYPIYKGGFLKKEFAEEIDRLDQELNIVNPDVIISLGATPLWALIGEEKISNFRGKKTKAKNLKLCKDINVLPTWHPAYVLRNPIKMLEMIEDLKLATDEKCGRLGISLPQENCPFCRKPYSTDCPKEICYFS